MKARLAFVACALALSGCDTMQRASSAVFGGDGEQRASGPGFEARVAPVGGSAIVGTVRFVPRADGVAMLVQLNGLPPGRYRVLVHENGNCTSRNGFSAGPPWSPATSTTALYDRVPILTPNTEGTGTLTARLPGVPVDQLSGRAVVVHDSVTGPYTAQPDVPNSRVACGVIGSPKSLLD